MSSYDAAATSPPLLDETIGEPRGHGREVRGPGGARRLRHRAAVVRAQPVVDGHGVRRTRVPGLRRRGDARERARAMPGVERGRRAGPCAVGADPARPDQTSGTRHHRSSEGRQFDSRQHPRHIGHLRRPPGGSRSGWRWPTTSTPVRALTAACRASMALSYSSSASTTYFEVSLGPPRLTGRLRKAPCDQ